MKFKFYNRLNFDSFACANIKATRSLNNKKTSVFILPLFFLITLNAPGILAIESTKHTLVAEADAIWNLQNYIDTSDSQVIVLLEKINNMPEVLWRRVIAASLDEQRQLLRDYLISRFTVSFPYFGQSAELYQDYIKLLNEDTLRLTGKSILDDSDVKRLINILKTVSRWKIKEMFYQTSALVAYPLLEVRKAANETLFVIQDDRIYPLVLKLAGSDNPVERTYAIDTLYYLKDERTLPILLQLLNDKNKSVRYYAVRSLDVLNMQDAVPFYVRIMRSDVNDEVRILTAQVLAKTKPPAAFNPLLEVLSDPNPKVRKAVLLAVNEFNNVTAAYFISRQLALESDQDLKIMQIHSLLALNNSGLMIGLNRILKEENNIDVLLWAVYAAGKLADINGYEFLLEKISHRNERVREEAAMALGSFKYKRTVPLLIKMLEDKDEIFSVQSAALHALELIDENSSLPDLYNLSLNHRDLMVRAEIKGMLKDMLDKRFK